MQFLIYLSFLPAILALVLFSVFMKNFRFLSGIIAFFMGLCAIVPITIIQFATIKFPFFSGTTFWALLATTFIFNGFIEETVKGALLFFVPKKKYMEEKTLLPFFACCLVAGFATGGFESVIYFLKKIQEGIFSTGATGNSGTSAVVSMVVLRMFTAVLLHGFCASLSGIAIFQKRVVPFIFAFLLHGAYNFFAGLTFPFWLFSIIALLFAILECRVQGKE